MPTRYIKESIKTSDSIDRLTWFEEVLFYRLIVSVDDFGRYDGRASIIKNMLFPLKENVTLASIERALQSLSSVHLLELYTVDGRRFLRLIKWTSHQSPPRATKSKYPDPIADNDNGEQLQDNCIQMQTDVAVIDNRNRNRNRESYILHGADGDVAAVPEEEESVIDLPTNAKGQYFSVTERDVARWQELYPAVDVRQELRNMLGWLESNPTRRKTRGGMPRFITGWLSKEQNKAPKPVVNSMSSFDVDDFFEVALKKTYGDK